MLPIHILVALPSIVDPRRKVSLQETLTHLQILDLERLALCEFFLSALLDRGSLAAAAAHDNLNGGGARALTQRRQMRLALAPSAAHLWRLNRALG